MSAGPALTPAGEILVEVTLTEDVWDSVVYTLRRHLTNDTLLAIAAIEASIGLARHHALGGGTIYGGLTSGQRQGYIDTGLIEAPLDLDVAHKRRGGE